MEDRDINDKILENFISLKVENKKLSSLNFDYAKQVQKIQEDLKNLRSELRNMSYTMEEIRKFFIQEFQDEEAIALSGELFKDTKEIQIFNLLVEIECYLQTEGFKQ
jgi:hypothetical protein